MWNGFTKRRRSYRSRLLAERIGRELEALNSDFRNAKNEYAEVLRFVLLVHGLGSGPFAGNSRRIKHRYLGGKV